jgi:NitT/TauT family transport system substrate-binding protein
MEKNKNRVKYLGLGLVVLAGIVLSVFWGDAQLSKQTASVSGAFSGETTHVRIANLPVVYGLPLYVALDKGYFKEAGLDVEVIKFEAPNQIIDAVMSGQVDLTSPSGALGIAGIANYKNPGKLKIYAISGGTSGNSGASFLVPVDSTLELISDLKGKKLGILAGTIQWKTITREILSQNGLDFDKDLTIVELAPSVQIQALASGQIDALLALEPIPTIAISKMVAKSWVTDPTVKYISDPSWFGAGVLNVEFAEKNPEVTAKVIEVLSRTIEEINKDPNQYRQYFKNYTPLTEDSISKVPVVSVKVCGQISEHNKDSVQKFFDIFTKHKVVDGKISVDDVLYCK